jgi:hypothetical protein
MPLIEIDDHGERVDRARALASEYRKTYPNALSQSIANGGEASLPAILRDWRRMTAIGTKST